MNVLLLYVLHSFAWFCFGAIFGIARGYGSMKMLSAFALGVISTSGHLIARHLGYLP